MVELADFFEAVDDAVDLLRHGSSVFSQQERAKYISKLRAQMAKGDESFKPFLSRVRWRWASWRLELAASLRGGSGRKSEPLH